MGLHQYTSVISKGGGLIKIPGPNLPDELTRDGQVLTWDHTTKQPIWAAGGGGGGGGAYIEADGPTPPTGQANGTIWFDTNPAL